MKYRTLLLDADGTLLDFAKAEARGIEETLKQHQVPFDSEILTLYSAINKRCWEEFEQGLLDKETLLVERFRRLFAHMGVCVDAQAVRRTYHEELGKGAYLIDGAYEMCEELGKTHDLYIITNGVAQTQYSRFAASGLDKVVKKSFISEEIGCPKPQVEYFERVFAEIPNFCKEEALIVGDSLTADIQGGINVGIDTCWYNPTGMQRPKEMAITYEIRKITDLKNIVAA